MSIKLDNIIPLGRRYSEYTKMFCLDDIDKNSNIIDCGGGPSSFNFEANQISYQVTSIDPIYQFSTEQISAQIDKTFGNMMTQMEENQNKFIWSHFTSVDDVKIARQSAMQLFIQDFEQGKKESRYIYAGLPVLPFKNKTFDIALCSHFLFLYSDNLSFEFHIESIIEMLRVADELRIFPLVDLNSNESPYLKRVVDFFELNEYEVNIEKVDYEFQKNANKMLKIKKLLIGG